jgi:hypothetical protein
LEVVARVCGFNPGSKKGSVALLKGADTREAGPVLRIRALSSWLSGIGTDAVFLLAKSAGNASIRPRPVMTSTAPTKMAPPGWGGQDEDYDDFAEDGGFF